MIITFIIKQTGTPIMNLGCFVLCLKNCIPRNAPTEPPINAEKIKVFSLILNLCFIAFCLSIP